MTMTKNADSILHIRCLFLSIVTPSSSRILLAEFHSIHKIQKYESYKSSSVIITSHLFQNKSVLCQSPCVLPIPRL